MGDYNFNTEGELGQTKRLGDLPEEIKKLEALQELGDANAFLDVVQSESLEDDEYMSDEDFEQFKMRNRRFIRIVVAVAAVVGLVVCIIGFKLMSDFLDKGVETPVEAATVLAEEGAMLVRSITDKDELVIYDLQSDQHYTVKTSIDTKITGRDGGDMDLKDIAPGDILHMRVITTNQMATEIRFPSNAWIKEGVAGCQVDMTAKLIKRSGEGISEAGAWAYTDDTLFLYQEKEMRPSDLTLVDTCVIQGIGNTVWSMTVTGYHGYLTVTNTDNIQNGTIQIDQNTAVPLASAVRMPIGEGAHELLINADNIEPRKETIFVIAEEEKTVDLSAAQSKTGVLIVKANVSDYKLYINGAEAKTDIPIVLPQGSGYDVSVYKHGYQPWNTKVDVNQPSVTAVATLQPEMEQGILTIATTPAGAAVTLDGVYLGLSPISRQMNVGEHDVTVQLNGYETYQGKANLTGATGMFTVSLNKQDQSDETQQRRNSNDTTEQEGNAASEFPAPTPTAQ